MGVYEAEVVVVIMSDFDCKNLVMIWQCCNEFFLSYLKLIFGDLSNIFYLRNYRCVVYTQRWVIKEC